MSSSPAPATYDQRNEAGWRDFVGRALHLAFKRGSDVDIAGGRLILTDDDTGERYRVKIASGVLGVDGPL